MVKPPEVTIKENEAPPGLRGVFFWQGVYSAMTTLVGKIGNHVFPEVFEDFETGDCSGCVCPAEAWAPQEGHIVRVEEEDTDELPGAVMNSWQDPPQCEPPAILGDARLPGYWHIAICYQTWGWLGSWTSRAVANSVTPGERGERSICSKCCQTLRSDGFRAIAAI